MKKYNWAEIESVYMGSVHVEPRITLKMLSEQFSVPYQTVRRYASEQKWAHRWDQLRTLERRRQRLQTFPDLDRLTGKEV